MTSMLLLLFLWSGAFSGNKASRILADELVQKESEAVEMSESEKNSSNIVAVDFSDKLLQYGGFPDLDEIRIQSDTRELEEHIYQALMNSEESIDVSAYSLLRTDFNSVWSRVLNDNGDLFHVDGRVSYYYRDTMITTLSPKYSMSGEELTENRTRFDEEVEKVKKIVTPWMSDMEIAMVVNDYLATHIAYDYDNYLNGTIPDDSYNTYGALVKRTAVCQGYTVAYDYLLEKIFGIPTEYVSSDPMNHAWNMVKIDGSYYHVDVTWNDPVRDRLGEARHYYFMLSDDEFRNRKHYDWISSVSAENTRFDEMFWKDVEAPFARIMDKYYYVSNSSMELVEWDTTADTHEPLKYLSEPWRSSSSGGSWRGAFSKVYAVRGKLYLSMPDGIYSMEPDGSDYSRVYSIDNSDLMSPYGFLYKDRIFQYLLSNTPNLSGFEAIYTADIDLGQAVESIHFESDELVLDPGGTGKIIPVILPKQAVNQNVAWFSSNTDVAEVNDGLVTAVSKGTAVISAVTYDGEKTAQITISVGDEEPEKVLTGIRIVNKPLKTTYFIGEDINLEGVYSDGSTEVLSVTREMITGFTSIEPITGQTVTITIQGKAAEFKVDIVAKALESINILQLPVKTSYVVGEELDLYGLQVQGSYNDGTKKEIPLAELKITGFSSASPSVQQVVTVQYENCTAQFSVEISDKQLMDVELTSLPYKTVYEIGEALDLAGMKITGRYNDATEAELNPSDFTVTGFDNAKATAKQTITLMMGDYTLQFQIEIREVPVKVVAGDNRFSTASSISSASYEKSDVAVLVQSNNFPDALSAGPLAYALDAPILLTGTSRLSTTTKKELDRLGVEKVIIMGGESAVSSVVEEDLKTHGFTVERIAGSNRYNTAVEVATHLEKTSKAVLASGSVFADALAAGSYAAKNGLPILLTSGKRISDNTMSYLVESGISEVVLVGGTVVIEEAVVEVLLENGIKVTRVAGKNRADTSAAIAEKYFPTSETVIVANGMEFADALAAAPYAAKINAPILLVFQNRMNSSIESFIGTQNVRNVLLSGENRQWAPWFEKSWEKS